MKKTRILLFLISLTSSLIINAQQKDITVTMTDGSTIEGKIEELNFLSYTKKSNFIVKNTAKNKVDLSDISLLEIEDKGRYETHVINGDKVLCYVKLDGNIKLLYHEDLIYTISDDNITLLEKEVGSDNYFKKNLALLVEEDPEFTKRLPDTEYKKSSIENFLIEYNENKSAKKNIIYSPTSGMQTKFMIGFAKRFDKTFDSAPISDAGIDFNSNTFTVEASFSNIDYANNLSLTTGLWYTTDSYNLEGFNIERQEIGNSTITLSNGETISQIDTTTVIEFIESGSYTANSIQLPVYLEFLNSNSFISYYGAFGFALNRSNIKRQFELSDTIEESKWTGKLLIEAGLALNPIDRIRINISYNVDTQINVKGRLLF